MNALDVMGWAAPLALAASLGLTRLVILLARQFGWVVKPKADRWHQKPTALYGGVAIFAASTVAWLALLWVRPEWAQRSDLMGLALGGIIVFLVGLRDDIHALNPVVKLFGQVVAAMPFLIGVALYGPSPAAIFALMPLMAWVILLTNSFNLLDNMDGLCGGTSAAVACVLSAYAALHGRPQVAAFALVIAFACGGFLAFNFRPRGPARIFMGDCGSLFLGHMLSGLAAVVIVPTASSPTAAILLPAVIMSLPLFDTSLVIVRRRAEGRAISQGGRDHTSHRLVYAGLTEKQAVVLLYSLTLLCGGTGVALERTGQPLAMAGFTALVMGSLLAFGIWLARFREPRMAVVTSNGKNGKHAVPREVAVAAPPLEDASATRN